MNGLMFLDQGFEGCSESVCFKAYSSKDGFLDIISTHARKTERIGARHLTKVEVLGGSHR